jgi:hypothetical protein
VTAHQLTAVGVRDVGTTRRMLAAVVSANYFDVLGRRRRAGAPSPPRRTVRGADLPVVVASHAFWRRSGFDPALLGGTVRVNERLFTVVGIAPAGFTGDVDALRPELFFPLGVSDSVAGGFEGRSTHTLAQADNFSLFLVGPAAQGRAGGGRGPRARPRGRGIQRAFPAEYASASCRSGRCRASARGRGPANETALTTVAVLFLGMTAAVLAIVCLNLASMLLARGQARKREFAIRLALGGGPRSHRAAAADGRAGARRRGRAARGRRRRLHVRRARRVPRPAGCRSRSRWTRSPGPP